MSDTHTHTIVTRVFLFNVLVLGFLLLGFFYCRVAEYPGYPNRLSMCFNLAADMWRYNSSSDLMMSPVSFTVVSVCWMSRHPEMSWSMHLWAFGTAITSFPCSYSIMAPIGALTSEGEDM